MVKVSPHSYYSPALLLFGRTGQKNISTIHYIIKSVQRSLSLKHLNEAAVHWLPLAAAVLTVADALEVIGPV